MSEEEAIPVELIAAMLQHKERVDMHQEAFNMDFQRLVERELSLDQIRTLLSMLSAIEGADTPQAALNWFEGYIRGVASCRKSNLSVDDLTEESEQ